MFSRVQSGDITKLLRFGLYVVVCCLRTGKSTGTFDFLVFGRRKHACKNSLKMSLNQAVFFFAAFFAAEILADLSLGS